MELLHLPTGIKGIFIKEYKPTGRNYTTQIMTDKGIYFAPCSEFIEL